MKSKIQVIIAMLIFGSIAIFVRKIDLPSSVISLLRGIVGSLFLFSYSLFKRQKISVQAIKQNFLILLLAGGAIGFNWIFLFQAYKYTTVSNATICYYFAPVIVTILSPFILKEKLTPTKFLCVIGATIGLFMIVNNGGTDSTSTNNLIGIIYGLLAAVLYAGVILLNKFLKNLSGLETTIIQLLMSVIVLFPYIIFMERPNLSSFSLNFIPYILILGIVHTGIGYLMYFTGMQELKGQTIAVLSYIDPITAVIISAVLLGESMTFIQLIGGVLILGSNLMSERLGNLDANIESI